MRKAEHVQKGTENMGVQHLWSILEPSKREQNIENLRDKTLCIDLSMWICEAQATKGLKELLKPYLRNVFFRTLYLASFGIRPVFVVDGVPPEIKRGTIVKRLQARGEHVPKNPQRHGKLNRSKFSMMCNEVYNIRNVMVECNFYKIIVYYLVVQLLVFGPPI